MILPPFYMESRLIFSFFMVEMQFSSRLMNSIMERTIFKECTLDLAQIRMNIHFVKISIKKINSRLLDL